MGADIIPFDEAAARIRAQRSRPGPADFFWMAAVAFWPLSLTLFAAQGAYEALLRGQGRR